MPSSAPRSLALADIDLSLDPAWFNFATTQDVPPLDGIVAQPRAVRSLELGLGIKGGGHNVFVVGLSGTNLTRMIRDFVAQRVTGQPMPLDWAFVNNFDEPDRPIALSLPPGEAVQLRRALRDLQQRLSQILPRALQYQGFNQEKGRLQRDYHQRCNELFAQIQELARARGLHIEIGQDGYFRFAPLVGEQAMPPEDIVMLSQEQMDQFGQSQVDLLRDAQPILEQQQSLTLQLTES